MPLTPKLASTLIATILLLASRLAGADGITYTPLPLKPDDLPATRRPVKLYSVNWANHFTGDYRYAVDVPVPPAKGGLAPSLSLTYSSSEGATRLGRGWQLPLDHVRRKLNRGVPRYIGPGRPDVNEDELAFRVGEHQGELAFVEKLGSRYLYRPRSDRSFLKFYFDTRTDIWTVQAQSGRV